MRSDAVGTGALRHQRRAHRIGICAASRVAQGGHMIDIHAEAEFAQANPLLPGFTPLVPLRCAGSLSASHAGNFTVASGTNFTPSFALPPERSIKQAAATGLPPALRIASRHSRDDSPVVTISSTISTGWFFFS